MNANQMWHLENVMDVVHYMKTFQTAQSYKVSNLGVFQENETGPGNAHIWLNQVDFKAICSLVDYFVHVSL